MKITLNITRPNGETEILNVTEKFGHMNQSIFNKIKESTKNAGKGIVNSAEIKKEKTNINQLVREYNNLHNEGAEGYVPDAIEYWKAHKNYKEWEETTIIK